MAEATRPLKARQQNGLVETPTPISRSVRKMIEPTDGSKNTNAKEVDLEFSRLGIDPQWSQ
jgi:hypothetical protein